MIELRMCTTTFAATAFGNAPNTVARCGAAFGDKYSLASGIKAAASALGGNADNAIVNTLFGNDISAISNIFNGADPGAAATGLAITNPSDYNAVSLGVKALGLVPNPLAAQRVALGVTSGGEYFGSKIVTPTIAESVSGTVAGGIFSEFTVGKLNLEMRDRRNNSPLPIK